MTRNRVKKWAWITLAVFVALQIYFVREMLAAELLFGLFFFIVLLIGLLVYLLKHAGELGLAFAKPFTGWLGRSARRGYALAEAISRKPFRHLRSESVR